MGTPKKSSGGRIDIENAYFENYPGCDEKKGVCLVRFFGEEVTPTSIKVAQAKIIIPIEHYNKEAIKMLRHSKADITIVY